MAEIEMVCIAQEKYQELLDSSRLLGCLYGAGVDNWEGYDIAMESYQEFT